MKLKVFAVALFSVVLMGGCQSGAEPVSAASPAPAKAAPEQVSTPASTSDAFIASGPLTVEKQLDVSTQRDGIVTKVLVDAGTPVRQGQLLAKLDDRQLIADRDAAKAQSDSIEADLKNWAATLQMAQVDLERSEKMWAAKLITQEQLDHDRFKLTATKYELDREQKNYDRSLSLARSLELELEKTTILAPFDGVVARRYVREGQRVGNGERLFWVTAVAPIRVKFTLPERYVSSVKRGSLLEVAPAELPNEKYAAKIVLTSPVIDPASGTFDVTAELVGPTGSLRPGMISNIWLGATK